MELKKLRDPFRPQDIEWRVQQSGKAQKGIWARVIPYVTARAIMERLDEVCGPENWQDDYKPGPVGGILCGISIRVNGEWVTKWDGAANTEVKEGGKLDEDTNVKGGFSASLKRAGVKWGIGRYLYDLDATYADIVGQGQGGVYAKLSDKDGGDKYYWKAPELPAWALPRREPAAGKATPPANQPPPPAQQTGQGAPAATPPANTAPPPPPAPDKKKPDVVDELMTLLSAVYEGTAIPVFDEMYKASVRGNITVGIQQYGKKVAYETALASVKADLAARIAKARAPAPQPAADPNLDIF